MNKDAVSDADGETFRASQGWGGDKQMVGPLLRTGAERGGHLQDPWEGAALRMHPGLGWGWGGQSGDDWGDSRVPVALRQPSRCLLTQKGCRHGANLPHGGGAWAGTETGEPGLKRFQDCDRDTWPE